MMEDTHEQEKDKARECVRRYGKMATQKGIPHVLEMAIGAPDDQITNFCDHYDMGKKNCILCMYMYVCVTVDRRAFRSKHK